MVARRRLDSQRKTSCVVVKAGRAYVSCVKDPPVSRFNIIIDVRESRCASQADEVAVRCFVFALGFRLAFAS